MNKRLLLQHAGVALVGAATAPWAMAQKAAAVAAWPDLSIFIPASEGGGWDQTGRAVGSVLQAAGLVNKINYENLGGKAGTLGLSAFAERYKGNPRALMVMGMVMLGGIAMHKPAVELSQLAPLAELTSEYLVVAVPANSPLRSAQDLAAKLKDPNYRASVVGGSAGGVDHMLLGMMLRALDADAQRFTYVPTSGGAQALAALSSGQVQLGISGYSEFRDALKSGQIRALAVSASRGEFGLPALREAGIHTALTNWRGLCAPAGLSEAQLEALNGMVGRMVNSAEWRDALRAQQWLSSYRSGPAFKQFIDNEQAMAKVVVNVLKLHG